MDRASRSRPAGSAGPPARAATWAGPLALAGLILLFTLACGRWMVAMHEVGHAETRQDIASVNQAVWNTSQGRLARASILYEGVRDHVEPVLALHALAYAAGGTIHTLLYLQAFLLSLGAIPFYALGRERGGSALEAGLLAASYLLLPPLHRLIEKDYFRTDQLLFPVLALLAYAVTVRRHRLALGAALLALCIRESGALAVVGLGVYWLCVERRVRAGLGVVAVGALWIPMVSYVLLPALIGHPTPHADQVRAPSQLADQLAAFWAVRWPVGAATAVALLLLRRRWAALLAVPALVAFLFYRADLRYVAPLFSVVWMAVADAVTQWARPGFRRAALAATLGVFALANVALGSWRPPSDAGIRDARPLLARVPPDASVCAESRVLVHLSLREWVYQFNREHYFPGTTRGCLDAEYFLLNRSGRDAALVGRRAPPDRAEAFRAVQALGVDTVAESGSWVLWRRRTLLALGPPMSRSRADRGRRGNRGHGRALPLRPVGEPQTEGEARTMAQRSRRKASRGKTSERRPRDGVVEIPGELAREMRPDLWDPTDPGFRLWTPRDTTGDPRREAGPFWPHRQARGPAWLGIPTFFRLPVALTPEDLRAGRVDVAIFGAPLDLGIGMRGAAYGPQAIRVSERYLPWGGSWSGVPRPHQHVRVDPFRVLTAVDYGDVAIDPFSTEHTIGHVREFVREIAETGAIPLMIGGDHSLLWPGAAGVADVYGPGSVGVIHFDAHADAGHNMLGHLASHGTPIRRLIADDGFPGRNFIQVGLRGYYPDDETFEWMRSVGMRSHYMAEVERKGWDPVLDRALKEALDGPRYLYISLDVDVMDPAYTPGTGTPEPGGLTPRELFPLLRRLTAENRVVGIDVVEMNPLVDPGYTTALNVNRCIREMLVGLALRKQGVTTPNYLDPRAAGEAPGPAGGRGRPKRRS